MKKCFRFCCQIFLLVLAGQFLSSLGNDISAQHLLFPYKAAGLTERQAAAHLLNRFTFGARHGEVDRVVDMGLEEWFIQQLEADIPDHYLNTRLENFKSLEMTNAEIRKTFPKRGQLVRMAVADEVIDRSVVNAGNKKKYKDQMIAYMEENGYRARGELYRELINQKILRAAYSKNQLQEVLTSFWFNHFNVSLTNNNCSGFVSTYERDVIRPNALGRFETILLATAKSPAMLTYLDNFKSSAPKEKPSKGESPGEQSRKKQLLQYQSSDQDKMGAMDKRRRKIKRIKKPLGLNENYAREIMELHTLGVDGGYTQKDVTEAARVLTGWTVNPRNLYQNRSKRELPMNLERMAKKGFVLEGDFLFAANRHDRGKKIVMGMRFPANGGYEEGVKLINYLAHHPSTAKFISTKLAVRFVSDSPPETLVNKMAQTFMDEDGDIRQVLITMVSSREFWNKRYLREKTKSPFELAMSAVRSLNAEIRAPYQLYRWINKMGEKIYYYQAPTGFPDNGQYWINTGSLLNRMNFGLALASGNIPGIRLNLSALNQHREPESAEAALLTYGRYLMPERNLDETIKSVAPLLKDPEYGDKLARVTATPEQHSGRKDRNGQEKRMTKRNSRKNDKKQSRQTNGDDSIMLAQVVGIIIGSPEFQRR